MQQTKLFNLVCCKTLSTRTCVLHFPLVLSSHLVMFNIAYLNKAHLQQDIFHTALTKTFEKSVPSSAKANSSSDTNYAPL